MKTSSICVLISFIAVVLADEASRKTECDVEPDTGPCKAYMKMYFYKVAKDNCEVFIYGGCEGNGNKYSTEKDCFEACGSRPPVITPIPPTKDEIKDLNVSSFSDDIDRKCEGNPDPGPCKGHFVKYFFNTLSGTCDSFIYGGCQGNDNRFASMRECERNCQRRTPSVKTYLPRVGFEFCFLPPTEGTGEDKIQKYYYDPDTKDCKSFQHGGKDGNANRFDNLVQCLKSCANSENRRDPNIARLMRLRSRH